MSDFDQRLYDLRRLARAGAAISAEDALFLIDEITLLRSERLASEAAASAGAALHVVTAEGYTQLPEQMVKELVPGGGILWFVRGKEAWEAWLEPDLEAMLAPQPTGRASTAELRVVVDAVHAFMKCGCDTSDPYMAMSLRCSHFKLCVGEARKLEGR